MKPSLFHRVKFFSILQQFENLLFSAVEFENYCFSFPVVRTENLEHSNTESNWVAIGSNLKVRARSTCAATHGCAWRAPDARRRSGWAAAAGMGQEQARENRHRRPGHVRVPFHRRANASVQRGVLLINVIDRVLLLLLLLIHRIISNAVVDGGIVRVRPLLRRERRGQVTEVCPGADHEE